MHLHDKLIPAGSVAFIFMCITTKNEMKSGEKEMSFFEKAGLSKYHRRGHIAFRSLVRFHCVKV
jgi:hypothetical protein